MTTQQEDVASVQPQTIQQQCDFCNEAIVTNDYAHYFRWHRNQINQQPIKYAWVINAKHEQEHSGHEQMVRGQLLKAMADISHSRKKKRIMAAAEKKKLTTPPAEQRLITKPREPTKKNQAEYPKLTLEVKQGKTSRPKMAPYSSRQCMKCQCDVLPQYLLNHIKRRHAKKMQIYECTMCEYKGRHEWNVIRHVQRMHKKESNDEAKVFVKDKSFEMIAEFRMEMSTCFNEYFSHSEIYDIMYKQLFDEKKQTTTNI